MLIQVSRNRLWFLFIDISNSIHLNASNFSDLGVADCVVTSVLIWVLMFSLLTFLL